MPSNPKHHKKSKRASHKPLEPWLTPVDLQEGFDWAFIRTIFDLTPLIFPVTKKRAMIWLAYFSVIGSLVLLEKKYTYSEKILETVDRNILWVSFITYGIEPVMLMLYMALARYPYFKPTASARDTQGVLYEGVVSQNEDTVLIIPCHYSASNAADIKSLTRVLEAALKHFLPENIVLANNGTPKKSSDQTKRVAQSAHPDIRHLFFEEIANKTIAEGEALKWVSRHSGGAIKYALLIDDDVKIPENYRLERSFFGKEKVKGIIYPILATASSRKASLLVDWQNLEYKLSDLALSALDAVGSAPAPHGACVLLELNTALKVFSRHTGRFKGEDQELGERFRGLYDPVGRLRFRVDMRVHFETNVPESYLGHGPNLWAQRVRSWSEAPFLYFWSLTLKPLLTDWDMNLNAIPLVKLRQSYLVISQCANIFRYFIMALEVRNKKFWEAFLLFTALQMAIVMMFNYTKLPPYLKNDFKSTSTFFMYKQLDNLMSHVAFWRAVLFSVPKEPKARSILDQIEKGKLPSIQLHKEPKNPSLPRRIPSMNDMKQEHKVNESPRKRIINKSKTALQELSLHRASSAPEATSHEKTKAHKEKSKSKSKSHRSANHLR